jgi:hypothetical protein
MMVVMVVSRRVGQVTLAVSERTSCRNLNGLKAIVRSASVSGRFATFQGIRTADLADPALVWKVEPINELECSGN